MFQPLTQSAANLTRIQRYRDLERSLTSVLDDETDDIAIMATVACELHNAFDYFHWTGFYRNLADELVIGPYQGRHGCLRIALGQGVCGTAAARRETVLVPDVTQFAGHIACSATTQSELVVPIISTQVHEVVAVLDIDSDLPNAFRPCDVAGIESIAALVARQWPKSAPGKS